MEKALLFFQAKLVTIIASYLITQATKADTTFVLISTLSFACVFVFEFLISITIKEDKKIIISINVIALIACFALGSEIFYPLFVLCIAQLLDFLIDNSMYYFILATTIILSFFIFLPGITVCTLTFIEMVLILYCRLLLLRYSVLKVTNEEQKITILEQTKKINDIKSLTRTLKYTVSIEERNRIAARIHDQLGHGISGSILLLEAAMLILKDQPDKSEASIQKAITNLREGVDEIRASLREERAGHYLIGKNEIAAMLEEFKVNYNKSTKFIANGDLKMISLEVWTCIHDNVKECLTNVLKHSNASEFELLIEVKNKVIKVDYKDNGTSRESFEKGIGLEAIEERTIMSKGRCFFTMGEKGFKVTNIFTY